MRFTTVGRGGGGGKNTRTAEIRYGLRRSRARSCTTREEFIEKKRRVASDRRHGNRFRFARAVPDRDAREVCVSASPVSLSGVFYPKWPKSQEEKTVTRTFSDNVIGEYESVSTMRAFRYVVFMVFYFFFPPRTDWYKTYLFRSDVIFRISTKIIIIIIV